VTADAIVHGILAERATLAAGPITVGDIWRIVPYDNTQGICHITEAVLREILEENAAAYNTKSFRGVWGLRWTFNPQAPDGKRTVSLTHGDGTAIKKASVSP